MESSDIIVNALQQLKLATYESLRRFDEKYSFDTYKNGLRLLETAGRVKRLVFRAGTSERYIWILPWYEDEANEQIANFQLEGIQYFQTTPATGRQLKEYFAEKYPAYHQIAYLAIRELVAQKRVSQKLLNLEGRWTSIYYLPERKTDLDRLLINALNLVNSTGSAVPIELADSLKISKYLASALLIALVLEGKIVRQKVGWSYSKYRPVFAYCKIGGESEATSKYRRKVSQFAKKQRKLKVAEDYSSKFGSACKSLKIDESAVALALSYFERAFHSSWMRGRETRVTAWSAFLLAVKVQRLGVTPGEIEEYSKIERRLLVNNTRELNEFLGLDVRDAQHSDPSDFLDRIVTRMKLPSNLTGNNLTLSRDEFLKETRNFLSSLPKQVFFGKRPESMAAASMYIVASRLGVQDCTQKLISEAADVVDVTLRNTMKAIEKVKPEIKSAIVQPLTK